MSNCNLASETGGRGQTWQPIEEQLCQKERGCWTLPCTLFKQQSSYSKQKSSKPSRYCVRLLLTNHFHYWLTWQHFLWRPHLQHIMGTFMLNYKSLTTRVRPLMSSLALYRDCKFNSQYILIRVSSGCFHVAEVEGWGSVAFQLPACTPQ